MNERMFLILIKLPIIRTIPYVLITDDLWSILRLHKILRCIILDIPKETRVYEKDNNPIYTSAWNALIIWGENILALFLFPSLDVKNAHM